jgi:hypothetical protein
MDPFIIELIFSIKFTIAVCLSEAFNSYYKRFFNEAIFLSYGLLISPYTVYWPEEYHRPNIHHDHNARLVKWVIKIHRELF